MDCHALKIFEILQFYDSKYSDKNQVTAKKEFSPSNKSCITLKGPKKISSHTIFYEQFWFLLAIQMKISNTRNLKLKTFD